MPVVDTFVHALRAATELAAQAAWTQQCVDPDDAPAVREAATEALREALEDGVESMWDLAVDPVEGVTQPGLGRAGALTALAAVPRGMLFRPGPAFYMEKLVVPPRARGQVSPVAPVVERLAALSRALGKPVAELTIYVLEKPRHRRLVDELLAAGARVHLEPAGDLVGGVLASIPGSGVDALMGTGGVPEGLLAACAVRALGGDFHGRLDPQLPSERRALADEGRSTEEWHGLDALVGGDEVHFCATGISDGMLLDGIAASDDDSIRVQSLLLSGVSRERQVVTSYRPRTTSLAVAS